jgi:ABC-type sugar transport system ATPase subunit
VTSVAQASPETTRDAAISCRRVSKTFGGNHAVDHVSITVETGTVHALVGENGAGKSTLLGIVSGRLAADTGEVEIFGRRLRGGRPRDARELGLVAVYQELTMVSSLSAEANVFLGQTATRGGVLSRKAMRRRYHELCEFLDVEIPPDAPAASLSVSQQQMLEIMRGVQSGGRILLLDEPSAALAERERDVLYRVLKRLRRDGTTVVIVSHNLDEVLALSDTISVLRDGTLARTAARAEWDKQRLIRAMVGREVEVLAQRSERELGAVVLQASDITLPNVLHDISVSVRSGEIVGLWGLVGAGRTTFLRSLAGLEPASAGRLELDGRAVAWPKSPRASIGRGLVMVPEDRKNGLVLSMDGTSNLWLGRRSLGWLRLRRKRERDAAAPFATFFGFRPGRLRDPVAQLSGGNQQKVLLAKWAARKPKVFLIDEPTRGIDVGAKSEVLTSLVRLAQEGSAIVVTSSELEEVLAISHRLLVFAGGRVVRTLTADDPLFRVQDIVRMGFREGEAST